MLWANIHSWRPHTIWRALAAPFVEGTAGWHESSPCHKLNRSLLHNSLGMAVIGAVPRTSNRRSPGGHGVVGPARVVHSREQRPLP